MTTRSKRIAIPLDEAITLANALRDELAPYCERVWTAGSVRRRKRYVGDIELCVIPKPGAIKQGQTDLFGGEIVTDQAPPDLLTDYLQTAAHFEGSPWTLRPTKNGTFNFGPSNKYLLYNEAPIDIFSTGRAAFGLLYFVRTGDQEWVVQVMTELKNRGIEAHPYAGVEYTIPAESYTARVTKATYVMPEESDVFELLGWPPQSPEHRTGYNAQKLRAVYGSGWPRK